MVLQQFPFTGTDAEASRISDATHNIKTEPIITKLYQLLHTSGLNQTEPNFNYSNVHSFNFYENSELTYSNESSKGAKEVPKEDMTIEKDSANRKRRVVNVRSDMTTPSPLIMERRRKPGETGSSAPLLNYIFDTYSNTHQHHRNDK